MSHFIRFTVAFCLVAFSLNSVQAFTLSDRANEVSLNHEISYWEDVTGETSLTNVLSEQTARRFKTLNAHESVLNLGFSQSVYWVKLSLNRTSTVNPNWILEIPYLGIDHIDLFNTNGLTEKNGSLVPISDRPVFSRFYAFPIQVETQPKTYYLRIRSNYPMSIPIRAIEQHRFNEIQARENLLQFFYFGGLISLLIYNLSLYAFIRDQKYILYSLFTFCTGLGIFAGNGYASIYLWQNAPHWDAISQPCLLSIASSFGILFSSAFLRTKEYLPKTHISLMVLGGFFMSLSVALLLSLWVPIPQSPLFRAIFILSLATPIIVIGAAIRNVRYNIHSARFFLMAWGALCMGVLVASARLLDMIPSNGLTLYALQIGSGLEMLLFSLALAYRIQWERQQREQAQAALIDAQQETVRALQISEERLENAVDARTQKLQHLLLSEQHMRSQYTRFCALIAHEFRNPLNIIQAQATVLDRDTTPSTEKNHQRTNVIRSAVSRLVTLFDQWLANDRVNMAMDQLNRAPINVGPWLQDVLEACAGHYIDHTLRLTAPIEPVHINADPHLLEIAVLNLIGNACKYSPKGSVIDVNTLVSLDESEVGIRIQDRGPGIAADQLRNILEPYVRAAHDEETPDGLGLGLAFVQRIMELHDGRIDIESTVGKGTTVTLWLHTD